MAATAQMLVGSSFAALLVLDRYPFAPGQAMRYTVAALLMALVARRLPRLPTWRDAALLAGVAFSGLVAFNLLSLHGSIHSDPASVGVVVGCVPIVLALAGPLARGERPRPGLLAAGVVVAVGAALVQAGGAHPTVLGVVLALGALACEAAFTLLAVPVLPRLGALGVSLWTCVFGAGMFWGWTLVERESWRAPSADEALSLVWLTVAVTLTAFLAWYAGVRRIGADRAGLFCGLVPVSAAATAAVLGTLHATPVRLAGVVAVGVGVSAGMLAGRRRDTRVAAVATGVTSTPGDGSPAP